MAKENVDLISKYAYKFNLNYDEVKNISFAFIGQQVLLVISNRLKIKARRLKILIFLHLRLLTYFKFADFLFGFFVLTFLKLVQFLPYQ